MIDGWHAGDDGNDDDDDEYFSPYSEILIKKAKSATIECRRTSGNWLQNEVIKGKAICPFSFAYSFIHSVS